jgi:predicted transcriptional regulator
MLQSKNRERELELFTGRTSYLAQLAEAVSKRKIAAVIGCSGLGRGFLIRKYLSDYITDYMADYKADANIADANTKGTVISTGAKNTGTKNPEARAEFVDLKRLSLSPERFALEFIGILCYSQLSEHENLSEYQTIEKLRQIKLQPKCAEIIKIIDNELQKIKPDQELLLRAAFNFAEEFATEQKIKLVVALENFDEILKFNNFTGIKDAVKLFFEVFGEKNRRKEKEGRNSSFVLSSSAVNLTTAALKPFQDTIKLIQLRPFDRDETEKLFEKTAGKTTEEISKQAYELSAGFPVIISELAREYKKQIKNGAKPGSTLLKRIFFFHLANPQSVSYFYCSKLFTNSINRARGESLLKSILKAVSQNKPMRLTEIAKKIYRSGPVTKSLLERLIEVDLIEKQDKQFVFSNPVLKQWSRLMFNNVELDEIPDEKELKRILEEKGLEEKFSEERVSEERVLRK